MAIMRRELPSGLVHLEPRRRRRSFGHPVITAALAALAVVVAYQLLTGMLFWAQVKLDDLRYGYPRSSQMDGYLGFGESNGLPTHFVALNLHGQVVVMYIAGDDPSHVTVLKGPMLFGPDAPYAPVTIRLAATPGGYPDLVVDVDHRQLVYADEPRQRALVPVPSSVVGSQ